MAKESLQSLDKSCIWRETFNSFSDVIKNGGRVNGSPTISNGVMAFRGATTDFVEYSNINFSRRNKFSIVMKGTKNTANKTMGVGQGDSIDRRFTFVWQANGYLVCAIPSASGADTSIGYVALAGTGSYTFAMTYDATQSTNATRLKIYINGVAQTLTFDGTINSTIMPGITNKFSVARVMSGGYDYNTDCNMEYVDVYNRTLDASEVNALYKNRLYRCLPNDNCVLDVNPLSGVIVNRTGDTFTNTGMLTKKDNNNVMYATGSSLLDFGNLTKYQITGPITLGIWVKCKTTGTQLIFGKDNGVLRNYLIYTSGGRIYFAIFKSNNLSQVVTTSSILADDKRHRVIAINDGTDLKIYMDVQFPVQSGGTGAGGVMDNDASNVFIGSAAGSPYTGFIGGAKIWNKALSLEEIAIDYNSEKNLYL